MKVYVASSWRNEYQQEVVRVLRGDGHEVYDFRDSGSGWGEIHGVDGGFHWSEIDTDWQFWSPRQYIAGLGHSRAVEGFQRDMQALRCCDACVMVMPCGSSACMEMGWAVGAGRAVVAYVPAIREPELMVKMAHLVTDRLDAVREFLRGEGEHCRESEPPSLPARNTTDV
jgi:hypothetical protein